MISFLLEKAENHNVVEHCIKRHRIKRSPCNKWLVFKVPKFSSFSCSNFCGDPLLSPNSLFVMFEVLK